MNAAKKTIIALLGLATILVAGLLLLESYYAFTNFKFGTSGDYARYTNMMWNTAHGQPFRYGLNGNYLNVHLSYTLGILGFLFHVIDHPFLLAFLQWFFMVLGGLFLVLAGRTLRIDWIYLWALLFYWTTYHFMQRVVLCEFHGVSLYLALVPALYWALLKKKYILPIVLLILGLREDAGLYIAPLLLYFGWKQNWKAAYGYAALALGYTVIATFILYPWINDISLLSRRQAEFDVSDMGTSHGVIERLISIFWIVLPILPLLFRRPIPLLVIPSLALLITLGSGYASQYNLRIHYPAIVMATLAIAILETLCALKDWNGRDGARPSTWFGFSSEGHAPSWPFNLNGYKIFPLYLTIATLLSCYVYGYLFVVSQPKRIHKAYQRLGLSGVHALWVAQHHVPKEGVLSTDKTLAGFVANRNDLSLGELYQTNSTVNLSLYSIRGTPDIITEKIRQGTWGVRYFDNNYFVAEAGYATDQNESFLERLDSPTVLLAYTDHEEGEEIFVPGIGLCRFWKGSTKNHPLLCKNNQQLPAGSYTVKLLAKTGPSTDNAHTAGTLRIYVIGEEKPLLETAIDFRETFEPQLVTFELPAPSKLHIQISGGDTPLWLDRIVFLSN